MRRGRVARVVRMTALAFRDSGTGTGFADAKLSEVLLFARVACVVRMTALAFRDCGTGTGFAGAKLSEVLPRLALLASSG